MKTKEWNDFVERYVHSEEMATELKVAFDAEIKKAIAEHEAKQWHKYPEEKPKKNGFYLVLLHGVGEPDYYKVDEWRGNKYWFDHIDAKVKAWFELPRKEGGEG